MNREVLNRDTLSRPAAVTPRPARRSRRGPRRRASRSEARNARAAAVFVLPFFALFGLCFLAPIGYALHQSLFTTERTGPLGLGGQEREVFAGLANYAQALADDRFLTGFGRVLLFGAVQIPLMIVLATALALLLESASARAVPFFRSAFFLPYGVPGVIASILWGFLYVPGISPLVKIAGAVGWDLDFLSRGTVLWSIANIVTWQFTGYNMLVLIAQLKAVPGELYEAARIDGASAWQVARHIKLPLIRPALVLTGVFSIIGTLQLFAEPMVLRPLASSIDSGFTPNLHAYSEAFVGNDQHAAAAEAVLLALVACVLSFGFLRLVGGRAKERG
ncbi:carbohydrate ABC transporter permease [Streptomyces lydicamycinicus]|uniref:Putative sugar ABC transporter permease protein n=1 Tax=Streptomyces lydicamycinicus TaxID=1546107 RepID=A0A0P4R5V2_9ACTN|nr:sugar ABC transporter permease [Streptomyces lydicamycinicus]GAO08463.1 putative sugar ABC transporter permease protein [Streptomyces lydicamycinicus]